MSKDVIEFEGTILESSYLACTNSEAFKFGPDMQDDMAAPSTGKFDEIVVGQYFGCNHWEAKENKDPKVNETMDLIKSLKTTLEE